MSCVHCLIDHEPADCPDQDEQDRIMAKWREKRERCGLGWPERLRIEQEDNARLRDEIESWRQAATIDLARANEYVEKTRRLIAHFRSCGECDDCLKEADREAWGMVRECCDGRTPGTTGAPEGASDANPVGPGLDDVTKLLILAAACSDVIYGGDRGWERGDFKEFVFARAPDAHLRAHVQKRRVSPKEWFDPVFGADLVALLTGERDRFIRLWQEERNARVKDMQERDDWLHRTRKAYRSRLAWHITANRANRRGRQAAEARVKELESRKLTMRDEAPVDALVMADFKRRAALFDAVEVAARDLPEDYQLAILVEAGCAELLVIHPDGEQENIDPADRPLAEQIRDAVTAAQKAESERLSSEP